MSECSKCYDKGYYRVGDADITCWDCCGIVKRAELARLRAEAEKVDQSRRECAEMYKRAEYFKRQSVARLEHLGDYIDNPDLFIAEAEAWRAVRGTSRNFPDMVVDEVKRQIARLDQLKAPTPTTKESEPVSEHGLRCCPACGQITETVCKYADGITQCAHCRLPQPTVTETKCDQCEGFCLCSKCGDCFNGPTLCPSCEQTTKPTPSPTVTVPRDEWERMKAVEEAWKSLIEVWKRDDDGICFDSVKSEIDHQIERLG